MADADAASRAEALARAEEGVRESTTVGARVRLYAEDGPRTLPGLLRTLGDGGLEIRSLALHQVSLDDVFLRCTGRSLRDADPQTERAV